MTASRIVFDGIRAGVHRHAEVATALDSGDRLRSFAAWIAARCPAGPEPITSRSKSTDWSLAQIRLRAQAGVAPRRHARRAFELGRDRVARDGRVRRE